MILVHTVVKVLHAPALLLSELPPIFFLMGKPHPDSLSESLLHILHCLKTSNILREKNQENNVCIWGNLF